MTNTLRSLETLYAKQGDAINAAVAVVDANGAPVRVVFNRQTRYYSISEEPEIEPWPDYLDDVAVVEPTEVIA